jgi:hypothetical protein
MSDAAEFHLASQPGSYASEHVVRIVKLPSGKARLEVLVRTRNGVALIDHVERADRQFTVSEVHGIIHTLNSSVMSHLTLTQGIQLALE